MSLAPEEHFFLISANKDHLQISSWNSYEGYTGSTKTASAKFPHGHGLLRMLPHLGCYQESRWSETRMAVFSLNDGVYVCVWKIVQVR